MHIGVCRFDQTLQGCSAARLAWTEFDVAHVFTGAFQYSLRIVEVRTEKEADIDVRSESVDISEGGVANARRRLIVVQQCSQKGQRPAARRDTARR